MRIYNEGEIKVLYSALNIIESEIFHRTRLYLHYHTNGYDMCKRICWLMLNVFTPNLDKLLEDSVMDGWVTLSYKLEHRHIDIELIERDMMIKYKHLMAVLKYVESTLIYKMNIPNVDFENIIGQLDAMELISTTQCTIH